jgi:DNA anti-recombination protein RmuC
MATKEALEGLENTGKALIEIQKQLKPFIAKLASAEGKALAQAEAVVALSVGTLRYMGARLRGLDQGRKSDDPLRKELNEMRRVLQEVEKMKNDESPKHNETPTEESDKMQTSKHAPTKRKSYDETGSKGGVKDTPKCDKKKRRSPTRTTASNSAKKQRQR